MLRTDIRERKHRLPVEAYAGIRVVSFTACVKNWKPLFVSDIVFRENEKFLLAEMRRFFVEAEVYLFMPDHAHFLLRGMIEASDVLKAMKAYKQQSGFRLYKHRQDINWQKDFYDHIVRREEEVERHIKYILNNPVKKGLVENWKAFPYKGSTLHNLDEWEC